MKKLILSVSCTNSRFDDHPDYFIVELTAANIARIKSIAKLVHDNQLKHAVTSFSSGKYFSSVALSDLTSEHDISVTEITEDMVSDYDCEKSMVENASLVIDGDQFWFTCIPKYSDEYNQCSTSTLNISALDANEPLIECDEV